MTHPMRIHNILGVRGRLLALLFLFGLPVALPAQNPMGTLRGTVLDASGARVPFASVEIAAEESSLTRQARSDGRGEFRVEDVPPGLYRVVVSAPGFAEARSSVTIAASAVREIVVKLQPGAMKQRVNVAAQASSISTEPVDTSSTVLQGVVTAKDLETIPLAHRSFANIAFLVPGTEPVEPSDPTKARITAVSFGGSSGLNVELSVDGGDNSDDYIGGFLQNYSPDAIQEFTVRTAQEDADTGRTTAGSVVIATKRGTDEWHGDAAVYERASALNARFPIDNPAPQPKQPFSRQNYVGTAGGPIESGKVWIFSSLEYVHEDASIAYSPATLVQFNALASLASRGLIPGVNSIAAPGSVPVPFHDYLATTRLDWSQSPRAQWFLRAAIDRYTTQNDLVQQATLPSTGAASRSNYLNLLVSQHYTFSSTWLAALVAEASGLHRTETRNSNLGFALAFPFSSTLSTISGFETFGDNQFVTPIAAFPVLRNQQKYQFRYDVTHSSGAHAPRFGVNFIHEPVLGGALPATAETLLAYPSDPAFYAANPWQFFFSRGCAAQPLPTSLISCDFTPAGNGSFSQNVQRLGLYVEDSWRTTSRVTVNYGLRYDTTFGLFTAEDRSQLENPALLTLRALQIPLINGVPHDYRAAIAPRLGIAYAIGDSSNTVIRAGFGLFYNDLAQNGWVTAFEAVNSPLSRPCVHAGDPGCLPGAAAGGSGSLIDPHYKTPYAIHATAGFEHAFNPNWTIGADYTHEEGNHSYRRYQYQAGFTLASPLFPADPADQMANVPNLSVFRTDNRSSYNGLSIHLQGNVSRRFNLVANYTLSYADTWGCVLGELFDYVNGVCNPLDPFAKGDYGPSGEDVRHRFVLAGTYHAPGGFEITTLSQAESARPFTLTTPVDVNGTGDSVDDRAVINGVQTALDEFRGTPYMQVDLRVSRPFNFHERWSATPFIEFFNLFNRSNPGANYVTSISALPMPVNSLTNATAFCLNPACTQTQPVTSLNQLRAPAGALGDFFGPGTTVGIPFAAQIGFRVMF
ncbi:MAG: carboxypeptidase regulatory-like domain-containing protein [Candidatus Acidiferrales bacterium]